MEQLYPFREIDSQFADFICRLEGRDNEELRGVVGRLSAAVGQGHICLDLGEEVAGEAAAALRATKVVGQPGDFKPLILDEAGRLYLYRYWQYEQELARIIIDKAAAVSTIDELLLADGLARLFPAAATAAVDWQKTAAVAALHKMFCLIAGGPGTGKTSTVVKILALLLEQAQGEVLRIALAAPTGKAAARLKEAISRMKLGLDCAAAIKEAVPTDVLTIHRLLGVISGSNRFRYSLDNRLPYDVVIIDEASMVALPLMAKLATALKPAARIILLGDSKQLASVEAGAVLGDIAGGRSELYSAGFNGLLQRLGCPAVPEIAAGSAHPLSDVLVTLQKNYRFDVASGIGRVSQLVNAGQGAEAVTLLKSEACSDIVWRELPLLAELKKNLAATVVAGYRSYLEAATPVEALQRFDAFRLLCPMRQGPYGVIAINAMVEEILADHGLIDPRNPWYSGRPILVTANDYNLKLFNGDIGIVLSDPETGGSRRVCFQAASGELRKISPARLPAHETVYAMTVHKAQGTELERIVMLLSSHDAEIVTRELLYTGITRAKNSVEIWGNEALFAAAVMRKIDRKSGLKEALWSS